MVVIVLLGIVGVGQASQVRGDDGESIFRNDARQREISAGDEHTCMVQPDRTLRCWGGNQSGQLGDGTTVASPTPIAVPGLTDVIAVAAGDEHTCALRSNGTVSCWGAGFQGQIGNGSNVSTQPTPQPVFGITTAIAIATGEQHTCAVLADGTMRCWGRNTSAQLTGSTSPSSSSTPLAVPGVTGARAVTAGAHHTCALLVSGSLRCWGSNTAGGIGIGTTSTTSAPAEPLLGSTALAVAAGKFHTCAVVADGSVVCWGSNSSRQLGTTGDWSSTPVPVAGVAGASTITAGLDTTCALLQNGSVRCWGSGTLGSLGNGSGTSSSGSLRPPTTVSNLTDAVALTSGERHTCAIRATGALSCWGSNSSGQLGTGASGFSVAAVGVIGVTAIDQVRSGNQSVCAKATTGGVSCWGSNVSGQLGNGTTTSSLIPTAVALSNAGRLTVGFDHSCATTSFGTVQCWGSNSSGQLGNGTTTSASAPVTVVGVADASAIDAGLFHSCAVEAGAVKCWGRNDLGQLGDATTTDSMVPVGVTGISTAVDVGAGVTFSCVLEQAGSVKCWGRNDLGQLGNGTVVASTTPVAVSGITTAVAISVGDYHACVLLSDATVRCWGHGGSGQLGTNNSGALVPRAVPGVSGATAIGAGGSSTCFVLADGVSCVGLRVFAGGINSAGAALLPVVATTGATSVSAGSSFACATIGTAEIRCWGRGMEGELGQQQRGYEPLPTIAIASGASVPACAVPNVTALLGAWTADNTTADGGAATLDGPATYGVGVAGQSFLLTGGALSSTVVGGATTAVSVELWARPLRSDGRVQTLVSRWSGVGFQGAADTTHGYALELHPFDRLAWQVDDASSRVPLELDVTASQLYDGQFHHIAATWSNTTVSLYIDGVVVASTPSQGGVVNAALTTPVRFGGPFAYNGHLDDPSIWGRELSAADVAALATGTPNCV